jgi:hypothetical protein
MKRFYGLMLVLCAGLAGCQVLMTPEPTLVVPTVAIVPTATPTHTPTATPTPTVTPTPAQSDITLRVQVAGQDNPVLPADTRTTVPVTVVVETDREDIPLDGIEVAFRALGGGQMTTPRVPLQGRTATTDYVTGESLDRTQVEIQAILDVPTVGRLVQAQTVTLVRQTVTLDIPVRQIALTNPAESTVVFRLQTDDTSDNGQYLVAIDPPANVPVFINDVRYERPVPLMSNTDHRLRFRLPPSANAEDSSVCISLPERPLQLQPCIITTWGAEGQALDWRIEPVRSITAGEIADMRMSLQGANGLPVETAASLCYRVLVPPRPADTLLLQTWDTERPFTPDVCQRVALSDRGVTYVGFRPRRDAWMLRWSVLAPGLDAPVTQDMIIAVRTATWRMQDVNIDLGDMAQVSLPAAAIPPRTSLYVGDSIAENDDPVSVLFALYVPETFINNLSATEAGSVPVRLSRTAPATGQLQWMLAPPQPAYMASAPIFLAEDENQAWREMYFRGNVSPNRIQTSIINQ